MTDRLDADAFVARLRDEGGARYHDRHSFHVRMHAGALSRRQLQAWETRGPFLPVPHL